MQPVAFASRAGAIANRGTVLRIVPLAAVVVSFVGACIWLQWQLDRSAAQFGREFVRQNNAEFAAGDTMTLTRKLEALSMTVSWVCIEGSRGGRPFFLREQGACGSGFLRREVLLALPENSDVTIRVTLTTPTDVLGFAVALILGQVILLGLLNFSSRTVERERMNVALERERADAAVSRAVASMTQMLAHDVRRPFTSLKMALRVLRACRDDRERVDALLDRLEDTLPKAIMKVEGLISDVMEIGSSVAPTVEPCPVFDLVDEALAEVFPDGIPTGIRIIRSEARDFAFLVERRKMLRAVANILQNARDAMGEPGGEIRVEARPVGSQVRLTLRNTNSHIQADALPRIFDSFFTAKKGGTGLGLAIAKKVTEAHGGAISCESSPEMGVAFHLDLPMAPSLNKPLPSTRSPADMRAGGAR